ncbi:MAG: hypothetical protein H7843_09570 [Nitrospirota bacterium]
MIESELILLVDELRTLSGENEWVEFKVSNCKPDEIGQYISALSNSTAKHLCNQRLIEGRYPNVFVSSHLAFIAGQKAAYIKQRGLDDSYYIRLVLAYLKEYGSASRKEIDGLLLDKLPDVLTPKQKENKIGWLLSNIMAKKRNLIRNIGVRRTPKWIINAEKADINKR